MSQEILKRDLQRNLQQRMKILIGDNLDLFEAAGISASDAAIMVLGVLMPEIISFIAFTTGDPSTMFLEMAKMAKTAQTAMQTAIKNRKVQNG